MIEIGKKYNRWTCVKKDETKDKRYYIFKCDCGCVKSVIAHNVEKGYSKSCGCYQKDFPAHVTYGYSHTRIDNIYKSMYSRCYIERNNRYSRYGKRGIKICEEWLKDKTKFFEWSFNNGYREDLTIDRIDNNGDYSPENCRWVTYSEQANNKSTNRNITINGETHTMTEWSKISGVKVATIHARLKRGWSEYDAVMKGVN